MKFILPGPDTVTLSGQTVDKLLRAGDGDAALLYLYILKTRGQNTPGEAAKTLGKSSAEISAAMLVLGRLGLILNDSGEQTPASMPVTEPGKPQYTIGEVRHELENGTQFSRLVEETQSRLGKILSPDDLVRLFGIYDSLKLPPEVIFQLITHCVEESRGKSGGGRNPTMRYIEKAAYAWEREGVFTLEKAEAHIKELERRKSSRGAIKNALQIKDRGLSTTERRYVDDWIGMGFSAEAVEIAYDRTVLKTGRLAWSYMDSIIKSWHAKGLYDPDDILAKDCRNSSKPASTPARTEKYGAPNPEEIERMKRLLKQIKEE